MSSPNSTPAGDGAVDSDHDATEPGEATSESSESVPHGSPEPAYVDSSSGPASSSSSSTSSSSSSSSSSTSPSSTSTASSASSSESAPSSVSGSASSPSDPTVRWYESSDADDFLSLYETVWGKRKSPAWFEWRFLENPAASGVEMVVAEADGQLVGAEPLVPYRFRVGRGKGERLDARQPVDWIVHPEYRRMGIFSAMTESLLEGVADDASVLFNFPNEALRPGIEQFGWRAIDEVGARYRVQRPREALAMGRSSRLRSAAAGIANFASPIVRGGLGVLDRVGSANAVLTVDRRQGVPVETVHSLYAANVPDRIHVPRDRDFLEWRFANPRWDVEMYVVRRHGEPVASGVFATESIEGGRLVRLLDLQPMIDSAGEADAFEAMLRAVLADHPEAAVFKLPAGRYPSVCRRYGFVRDDVVPFDRLSATTYHAVRPLDGVPSPDGGTTRGPADDAGSDRVWNSARIDGEARSYDLSDPADWLLAPGDMDVA